jgi:periplasmic protein CpxP/Spy
MFQTVATIILLSTLILSNSLPARSADLGAAPAANSPSAHEVVAQDSQAPATTEPAPEPGDVNAAVEARIKELHNKLDITAAQQTQWDNLVQVMRDNAKAMMDLQKQRAQDAKSMTAVDAVKSYADVIRAHEAGMNKFVPAFETLYASMSDAQKKTADAMFQSRVRSAAKKASS